MISIKELIGASRAAYSHVSLRYANGVLYVLVADESFVASNLEHSTFLFLEKTGISGSDLNELLIQAEVSLGLGNASDLDDQFGFLADSDTAGHWLPLFDSMLRDGWASSNRDRSPPSVRAIHFYGFKGGQARSSVLALLGQHLADTGYRVLVVDADIEAPSLHLMFGVSAQSLGSSLLGIAGRGVQVSPVSAYGSAAGGSIDLIATFPSIPEFEMDVASFVLRASLDTTILESGARSIFQFAQGDAASEQGANYDYILFDHRTGLSASVLPIVSTCPGPVVINLRPDGLSDNQDSVIQTLLAADPATPGAFICFSLDPERRKGASSDRESRIRENLLNMMADALSKGAEDSSPEEFDGYVGDYFVPWFHDRAFLQRALPSFDSLSKDNQESILQLRRVLGIEAHRQRSAGELAHAVRSLKEGIASPSGAVDTGWFVETPDAARLLQPSLPSFYVYGRKGTGKSRLFSELASRGLGRPLHAADDFRDGGLPARSALAKSLLGMVSDDFNLFWWAVFLADLNAIASGRTTSEALAELVDQGRENLVAAADPSNVSRLVQRLPKKEIFLVDGVETAVEAGKTVKFVGGLFDFLSTLQNDVVFAEKVRFRVFVRSDLPVGQQNIEQQVYNRKIDLRWDENSIFHYVLAGIGRLSWFRNTFPHVCSAIDGERDRIRNRGLSQTEYEDMLLRVFPLKLRRNNLLTLTFLRTYFSDAAGEGDSRSSFYPRVFLRFLERVGELGDARGAGALDTEHRVAHDVVLEAFGDAARDFINEVKQELRFALDVDPDVTKNGQHVDQLLESLSGQPTPFSIDVCVADLSQRLGKPFIPTVVRNSLNRMKNMGIFEDHPNDPRKWRAGRLFKEGLRMKYVRK